MPGEAVKKVSKTLTLRARALPRDEGGAVAVMLALMLTALLSMLALAMDLGRAWNLETELQHAADACALAGSTQLDGFSGARVRAIEACVDKVSPPLVDNQQRFASDGLGVDVTFSDNTAIDGGTGIASNPDIRFYSVLPAIAANSVSSSAIIPSLRVLRNRLAAPPALIFTWLNTSLESLSTPSNVSGPTT